MNTMASDDERECLSSIRNNVKCKKINLADVSMANDILGAGGFAAVHRGHYRGMDVAVKVISKRKSPDSQEQMVLKEARSMCAIAHQSIVRIYGIILDNMCGLVLEFMHNGSLRDLQEKLKCIESHIPISVQVEMMVDVADAMRYLHSATPSLVHCDLKLDNILISDKFKAKVGDFGVSTLQGFTTDLDSSTHAKGTLSHLAPELLKPDIAGRAMPKNSPETDVWSFGVTLFELITEELLFTCRGLPTESIKQQILNGIEDYCMEQLQECEPQILRILVSDCLQYKPSARTNFERMALLLHDEYVRKYKTDYVKDLATLTQEYQTICMEMDNATDDLSGILDNTEDVNLWKLSRNLVLGHFAQPFIINLSLDKKYLELGRDRLKQEIVDEPWARRHAIMNLIGVAACLLDSATEGKGWFCRVLKEDEYNLNALKNLEWIENSVGRQQKAIETKARLQSIFETQPNNECLILKARAMIEIARAACSTDQHLQQDDILCVKKMFQNALSLGAQNPDKDEYHDWRMGYAFHLMRLARQAKEIENVNDRFLKEALRELYDVAQYCETEVKRRSLGQLETGDSDSFASVAARNDERVRDMSGKAWAFAGVLLVWYKDLVCNLSAVVQDCDPSHAQFDGLQCLRKAEESVPKCGAVLRRIAQTYMDCNMLAEAQTFAEAAIEAQPLGSAFYVRGQLRLQHFRNGGPNHEEHLKLALDDLMKAYDKFYRAPFVIRDIAVVLHYSREYDLALEYFKRAECATGGDKDHSVYEDWAKCLDDVNEPEAADEKRKIAEEIFLAKNESNRRIKLRFDCL